MVYSKHTAKALFWSFVSMSLPPATSPYKEIKLCYGWMPTAVNSCWIMLCWQGMNEQAFLVFVVIVFSIFSSKRLKKEKSG